MNKIDLTGQRFGKLTVVEEATERRNNRIIWLCRCDCGNQTYVSSNSLCCGRTKSCGCIVRKKYGLSQTRLYNIWNHMLYRCYNRKSRIYKYYGARGINVCQEWRDDFLAFYNWALQNGYKEGLTIDRIDCNGNYNPQNCRWTDIKGQQRNKNNNCFYDYYGEKLTIGELSEMTGINYHTIYDRLHHGWDIKQAIETPVRNNGKLHNISSSL